MISKFFRVLFEPGESGCFSTSPYGTEVRPLRHYDSDEQFFVINPMHTRRLDSNVTAYRNILVEFDKLNLDEQRSLIEKSGLPYSTLVYSGGKSLHAIISLQWPLTTKEAYKELVGRIYERLGGKAVVDCSTSNPSRFSRTPDAIRDNGKVQTLLEVHERVPNAELLQWLGPAPIKPKVENLITTRKLLTGRALAFITYGAPEGEWNSALFTASCDLFRSGFTFDEAMAKLEGVTGHLDSRDKATIKSAFGTVCSGTIVGLITRRS